MHPFAYVVTSPIKIDIWSDIACPWCYIGKRHLEGGLAALGDDAPEVEIEYHSFELAPDTPVDFEGSEVDFLAGHKGIPVDQARMMIDRVTGVAANAGLPRDEAQHSGVLRREPRGLREVGESRRRERSELREQECHASAGFGHAFSIRG